MTRALLLLALSCGAPSDAPTTCEEPIGATCCGTPAIQAQAWCVNGRAVICAPQPECLGPVRFCFDGSSRWRQGNWLDIGACDSSSAQ